MTKKIIILNLSLFIWSMGNKKGIPSIYNVQKRFVTAGHEVHFLIPDDGVTYSDDNEFYVHKFWVPLQLMKFISNINNYLIEKNLALSILTRTFYHLVIYCIYYSIGLVHAIKITLKVNPDVVYGHTFFFIPLAFFIAKIFSIPNVSRIYGVGSYQQILKNDKYNMLLSLPEIIPFKIPSDLLIITNDGTQGNEVASKLKASAKKIAFWMNGVDKQMYLPTLDINRFKTDIGISPTDFMILTVSRLEKWKHVDRIIKVMPEICMKDKNVKCIIVGDGPQKEELKLLAKNLSVDSNVIFIGSITHDEVKKFMNATDLFVSLYDLSNVGNPLLEAMVCGKTIITLDVGGTNSIIKNSKNGILIKMNEFDKIPEIVDQLKKDAKFSTYLGKNARYFANENFQNWNERSDMEVREVEKIVEKRMRTKEKRK